MLEELKEELKKVYTMLDDFCIDAEAEIAKEGGDVGKNG